MARTIAGATPGRTNRRFLIVALLFGAVTAALFYAVTARGHSSTANTQIVGPDISVVVAKVPIKQRTTITPDMLELKSISTGAAIGGAFTNVNDAVGKVTKYPIEVNQQVIASAVVDTANPAVDGGLALVVPTGYRAMSIQISQVFAAGGLILPGDYVDLMWTCCDKAGGKVVATKTLLPNVQVAAIAQSVINSGPVTSAGKSGAGTPSDGPAAADGGQAVPDAATMTLLLTPEQAQLVFLAEQTGTLRAELRGFGDQSTADAGITLFTQVIPPDALKGLPDALRPDFAR
jgi:pilus assembly protein CpaB